MATEYEIIEKLDNVCKNILNTSKNQLYVTMRYLSMAFEGLAYAISDETESIGTDGFYLYYAPVFLMEKYSQGGNWINRGYLHMVFHCILKHPVSMEEREERLWNVSCDIACEFIIDGLEIKALKKGFSPIRTKVYSQLKESIKVPTAQSVYRLIVDNKKLLQELSFIEEDFYMDDHSFWQQYRQSNSPMGSNNEDGGNEEDDKENNSNEPEQAPNNAEDFNDKWKQISNQTATEAETFSRERSDEMGDLTEFLRIENRQRYDYKSFLEKFTVTREIMQLDLDSYDYIYYTYGLQMYKNMPLIESLEYSEIKKVEEFVIVIDTSASCEDSLIRKFLEETYSVLSHSESFFKKISLHIIQCDNKIQSDKIIVCKEDFQQYMHKFEIKGGGGTDFGVAFDYVNKLCDEKIISQLKGLIYFTDGYGAYPKTMPAYDAAFVFLDDNYEDKGVPPWAIEIVIGRDEISKFGGN